MESGAYQPLSERDMQRIHDTALDVLEEIGIADPIPEILEYALPKGCTLGDDGRLRFPRGLVEDVVARIPREVICYARHPKDDLELRGTRVATTSSGETVAILDYETQKYRPSTLVDLYDVVRLVDQLEHIHGFSQPFIATDFSHDVYAHDMNVVYTELAGTEKPIAAGVATVAHIDAIAAMCDLYTGEEGAFLKRPFVSFGGCPIVSPLRFAVESAEVLVHCTELGIPYDPAIASQAGATAPATLAGSMVQTFAETLACLVVVNAIRPETSMYFGMWPFISDLRTGSFTGGSGEEALIIAATAQMSRYYGLVSSVPSGMTDSKTMDAQAGFEKGITTTAVALAGGNMIATYPGAVGSLMGTSFEGMVIDDDMTGSILRLVRGVEVTDDTLSFDAIKDTAYGAGHFLDHEQTVRVMQTEYLYPKLSDRSSVDAWEEAGGKTIYDRAHERVVQLLSTHYPNYIDPVVDAKIRARFPIELSLEAMQPGPRWG